MYKYIIYSSVDVYLVRYKPLPCVVHKQVTSEFQRMNYVYIARYVIPTYKRLSKKFVYHERARKIY